MNNKTFVLYCLLPLLFCFYCVDIRKWEIVKANLNLLCADDPSFLIQCKRTDVSHIFRGPQLKAELYFSDLVALL